MVKLEDYTVGELKKMISSFNKIVKFAGYSKLKKAELIKMLRTHPKIKVEEGANAVKLSIKTDQDFEKQTKVKKEKVKKEVKKEVEKLDDIEVVVEKKGGKAKPHDAKSEKQKERKENYVEEDENLKLYEEGKREMNEGHYKMLLKRYNQKLEFSDDDYDDLMKRLIKLKPVEKKEPSEKQLAARKKFSDMVKEKSKK
jgi:hypothetical protein